MGQIVGGMSERMFGANVRRNCQDVWRGQITRRISGEEMSGELSEGMWAKLSGKYLKECSGRMSDAIVRMFGGANYPENIWGGNIRGIVRGEYGAKLSGNV